MGSTPNGLWSIDVFCRCPECTEEEFLGVSVDYLQDGYSIAPNGNVYGLQNGSNDIFQINTATGTGTMVLDLPFDHESFDLLGLAFLSNTVFYSVDRSELIDTLYEINLVTGVATPVGPLNYRVGLGDLTFFNGILYYVSNQDWDNALSRIILSDPIVNEYLVDLPDNQYMYALTATDQCHTLLSYDDATDNFVLINALDGDIVNIGHNVYRFFGLTGLQEFQTPGCEVSLDLDCNDSSGATGPDYNGQDYSCITPNGVMICDFDLIFLYDTLIDFVRIDLAGNIPDGNLEYLELEQSFPNLTISGSGSQTILLESDGEASTANFKSAMKMIRYKNDAFIPIPGVRTVQVASTTLSGTSMNPATAFVEVIEWPPYDLYLGPDVVVCEGEEITLNTFLDDVEHIWSTNSNAQSITVSEPGTYSVTVTGDEFCPNIDSINVSFVPSVMVSLGNDQVVCEGEEVVVTLETDSPYPLTIVIASTPGGPFTLTGITGNTEIPFTINEYTSFVITSVSAGQPICLEIDDEDQLFDVIPSYIDTLLVAICEGDSILIDDDYIYLPGLYTNYDNTQFGCDSIITFDVSMATSISIFKNSGTCVAADTGIFFQVIVNPAGCDTLIETHVTLGTLDTTFLSNTTCSSGAAGQFTNSFTSIDGCDSVVVNSIVLLPPQDTSWIYQVSCDSMMHGVFQSMYSNQSGCDSLAILTVFMGVPDTTYVNTTSCDSSSLGVFETVHENQYQCDSLVITMVTFSESDSTFIIGNTCDDTESGIFTSTYLNRFGCDSIVVETVSWIPEIHIHIQSTTCHASSAGLFIDTLVSIEGCDSIVTNNIVLLPVDVIQLSNTTCDASAAGQFITTYLNQWGCDSTVTLTVQLLPTDTISLIKTSCHPAEVGVFTNILTNQFGCDSMVTLTVTLAESDTTFRQSFTCFVDDISYEENLFAGTDGCDSLVITSVDLYDLPEVNIMSQLDYNGFDVSCYGAADGSILAQASGTTPFTYLWNTNGTNEMLTGIRAGDYAVTVTDGNGCTIVNSIVLQEPQELMTSLTINQPDCFLEGIGSMQITAIGGAGPYQYSIDGAHFQSDPEFENLSGGMYELIIRDVNDCEKKELVFINTIVPVNVDLGEDKLIKAGDEILLQAIVNIPFDSLAKITWSGIENPDCPECPEQLVAPLITSAYSVEVISTDGCKDHDEILLTVEEDDDLYIPNVFSPNEDGINDVLVIWSKTPEKHIQQFIIFDRWGNMVFEQKDFEANNPSVGWDGRFDGEFLNSAVFAYKVILDTPDKVQSVRSGSLTLIR